MTYRSRLCHTAAMTIRGGLAVIAAAAVALGCVQPAHATKLDTGAAIEANCETVSFTLDAGTGAHLYQFRHAGRNVEWGILPAGIDQRLVINVVKLGHSRILVDGVTVATSPRNCATS